MSEYGTQFDGKVVFLTGGTGSWGQELTRQLLANTKVAQIRVYSRGEHRQVEMKRRFAGEKRLRYIIGDVRDRERLLASTRGVDYIFHLAALKHVPVCEENPWESVQTNVIGMQNVIDAAVENGVTKVIDISTDKAVDPYNIYGTCKAVGEKLTISANLIDSKTRFVCIRGGNVLGTNGSIVPLLHEQILTAGEITITDERMTRFMMRLSEAIELIFKATAASVGGEIFVMKMPALRITDLADVMVDALGKGKVKRTVIGIRPGEKLHEVLVSRYESPNVVEDNKYHIILPNIKLPGITERYGTPKQGDMEEFSSLNAKQLTKKEIKEMLASEGWLDPAPKQALSKEDLRHFHEREGWVPRR